jgi:radical SAM protein with 4Fe4S-binding SPASM domain
MACLLLDDQKLIYHLDRVNAWIRGEDIYPLYMAISPTTCCNLKCIFCAYSYLPEKTVFLKKEIMHKILKEFRQLGVRAVFYSGEGEPLMNKGLPQMIIDTYKNSLDAALNTNGILFTKDIAEDVLDKLTFIRFSVNAGTVENYQKIHGCPAKTFDTVINNIREAVKIKKKKKANTTIGVQCLFLKENADTILDLAKLLKEIQADYLAIKPFLKHPRSNFDGELDIGEREELIRQLEALSTKGFQVVVRRNAFQRYHSRTYKHCLSLPFMAEIDASGDVYPCGPYLGHKEFVYGNIYKNSFKEIWESKRCRDIINFVSTKLCVSKCMPNCRNDAVNRFLWQLKNPPDHVNFI